MLVLLFSLNSYSATDLDIVGPDITPPDVVISQPSAWESTCNGQSSVQLTGTAFDDYGIVAIRWENESGESGDCSGVGNWALNQMGLHEGDNLICVTAEDSAGNVGTSSVLIAYHPPVINPAPTITGISPNIATNVGSVNTSRLTGTGFLSGATVKLTRNGQTDIVATGITVVSATQISCTLPIAGAAAGVWNVVVTNSDAQSGTLANGFTITDPAPIVTAITPNIGVNNASVNVTNLAGTGFMSGATVKLTKTGLADISATNVVVVSATRITCTLPITGAGTGAWNVTVTNIDAQSGTLANGFNVTAPAPTVTAITPNTGVNNASVDVTNLTGTGFVSGAVVKLTKTGLTDISATNVAVVSSTQISCTLPIAGAPTGVWNIVVANPDGQSGTLENSFTVKGVYTLIGTVNLADYTATPNGVPVTVEVCIGTNVLRTVNTNLDALSEFSISNISPGTYNVGIKASHWLRRIVPVTVSSADGATTTIDVILTAVDVINGDIDGNNKVDFTDYVILSQQYKRLPLATTKCADMNGDGAVNFEDYSILMRNYKKIGE
jgi:hypothetical protein